MKGTIWKKQGHFLAALLFLLVGCDDEAVNAANGVCEKVATDWSTPDFESNAATALALREQLDALVTTMREAEQGSGTIDEQGDLEQLLQAGTPSLNDVLNYGYHPVVTDAFADFVSALAEGSQDLVTDQNEWAPGIAGGVFGTETRAFNTGALELRQFIDKGLFAGGAFYPYALSVAKDEINAATIDELAALFGADAALDPENVTDSANYAYRMGYFGTTVQALIEARAYLSDPDCGAEVQAAVLQFFRSWELSMYARASHYVYASAQALSLASSDDEIVDALHDFSEGMALAFGYYGMTSPDSGPLQGAGRIVTDEQIESIATALGVDLDDLSASSMGDWLVDLDALLDAVELVESTVADAFGLSAAQIESFREPTEG